MQDSKYPWVTILSEDPDKYTKDSTGATIVPHGRPEFGQPLEESNYYEFTADSNMNDIMRSVGLPSGDIIMGPKKAGIDLSDSKATTKKGRRTKKVQAAEEPPKKVSSVVWDIPGVGDIKASYSDVVVGDGCVVLYVSDTDTSFIPKDYRENNQAVYIMTYRGIRYNVIYSGLKYVYNKYNVYILIGSEYDG